MKKWLDKYNDDIPQAQLGKMLAPITGDDVAKFFDMFSVPQKAVTKMVTGKYQTPSEAMDIKNPVGAFATDMILDPVNLMGAGAVAKTTGAYKNAYKLNPWAFKANPEAGYRMIGGKEGYLDALTSGQIRPTGVYEHAHFNIGQPLNPNRLSAEELIQAGSPGGYKGPYMAEMQQGTWQRMSDAFSNSPEMQEQFRLLGKDKDVWQHPLFGNIKVDDPRLKLYKEHWLKGYKEVPKTKKKAQNGIEGTMGGLTDVGFNYNGAWGGTMQMGGSLEKIKSILNPFNWGVEDYTDEGDFKKAYSSAKKSGEKEFMYKDKRYNTKYAGTPRQEVGTYGVDGKPVHPMDINHPSQVNLYPAFGKYLPGHVSAMVSTDPESASVDYSSTGNMPWGIGVAKNKGERSYFVYGNDQEKFYNKAASLPTGNYFVEDEYTPSDWNLLTNNCADNVCDAFGIPRNKGIQTPSGAVSKIKENYPTLDVTGRTQKDYSNLVKNLDQKDVLKNSDKLTSIYFSPDTENELKKDIGSKIQKALRDSGYDLPKSYIKGNKWKVDKVLGDETLTALKDWQKKNKSLAMGGGIPGAVGFTYARVAGAAPANGPYAKKTKASAQDGRAVSDNTRLKPIIIDEPIDRETVRSTNKSYVMSPQEALLNKFKGVKLKESQDRLNKTAEKITAVGSLSPNPLIRIPSAAANFTLGAMNSPTPTDRGLDYMGLFGSTPSSLNSFKQIGRRAPFFKGITALDALSDIFEFTPSEDLPKKQNGGEMKFYQEGLDWKPRNISRNGSEIPVDPMGYWNPDNVGEPVIIPSNEITMQGVYEPLLGISDTGDTQMMYPGEDYEFDGESVTEYPMAKSGMSVNNADAQPIEKLDQLLNFTNYNKPTKGGWLDKYQ